MSSSKGAEALVDQLWRTPVIGSLLVVEVVVGHPELQIDA
jgi:hypothetical protein